MNFKINCAAILLLLSFGCNTEPRELDTGLWHAELAVMDGKTLPFTFELSGKEGSYHIKVFNAEEVIEIDSVQIRGDSIIIRMPVYEGYLAGKFSPDKIEGNFIKESLNRVVPFVATSGKQERFPVSASPEIDVSGNWAVVFNDQGSTYPAKGIFKQRGSEITGTFRTTTGDYRYLQGVVDGDSIKLSTFDGAHAFLFTARAFNDSINGAFYSGNHSKETFRGVKDADYELPEDSTLTYLKEGYDKLQFSFPDERGQLVSLADPIFQNKVVIVQIMGTWCPNCLDESRFLAAYLKENVNEELQVVALAFEYAKTREAAFRGIDRLRSRLGIDYPILLAQYGTSNKMKANEKLPMLNQILSYPTTIFIDKKGLVRKIHTGFNGPATGDKYEEFKKDFNETINTLLAE